MAFALIGLLGFVAAVWSGAQVATLVSTGGFLSVSFGDALGAMFRLTQHGSEPALAWPEAIRGSVPGPWVYWPATVVVGAIELTVMTLVAMRVFSYRVGQARRERLGVNANARFAKMRDLKTIVVAGPERGRLILGTVNGRLVATENRRGAPTKSRRGAKIVDRQGDRSAVAVVGPQRSGKTVNVISGILEWDGPAILSTVRDDLLKETFARRSAVGTCFVFDPLETLELPKGAVRVGWSPLDVAGTVSGAMEAASFLLEAAPLEGTTNANYFSKKGEALLWPILFAAAIGDRTMANVVQWLAIQDGTQVEKDPAGNERPGGEIRKILRAAMAKGSSSPLSRQAGHAMSQFDGFWKLDPRTRSDIYSTSQTLVQPWEDPLVSYASATGSNEGQVGPPINLKALLTGRNTLYVVQPLKSTQRFAVVFGGLLGSLVKDQAYEVAHRYGKPLPDLLVVIDEAGNTPLQWLPSVASTCSGIGVLLVTVWQSKAQIDAIYQKQADPLLTNHGSKIFFAGVSDESTLRYVSYLGGEEEVHMRSSNADVHLSSARRSIGDSTTQRKLLPAELLRQVLPGEGLLIHGTLPPAHIKSRRYWEDSHLVHLAKGEGEDMADWEGDPALARALDHDRTPRAEVLNHIPRYEPPKPTKGVDAPEGEDEPVEATELTTGPVGGHKLGENLSPRMEL